MVTGRKSGDLLTGRLVKAFDFHRMNKSPAVFDLGKLKWMNGEYIKAMDFDKFYERAEKYVRDVITKDYDLKKIAALVKSRIEIFPDIEEQIDFFEAVPEYDTAMYCHKKMKTNERKFTGSIKRSSAADWKLRKITAIDDIICTS